MTKFILFAHARSGSTSLARALNAHPGIKLAEEPFSQKYSQWNPGEKNYIDFIDDATSLEQTLIELFSSFDGIKILDYQLPEELYTHMLLLPQYKVILLRRRNLLQAIVSGLIAEQTDIWHIADLSNESEKRYETLTPLSTVEIEKKLNYQSELQEYYRDTCLRRSDGAVLMVDYEELYTSDLPQNRAVLKTILQFLEVSDSDITKFDFFIDPGRSKINDVSRYRLLPNGREINEMFGSDVTGWLF